MVSLYSSRQDKSTYIQHDLVGSPRDLDLMSNFDLDLLRSPCICFDGLDERNTMAYELFLSLFLFKRYLRKPFLPKMTILTFHDPWRLNY